MGRPSATRSDRRGQTMQDGIRRTLVVATGGTGNWAAAHLKSLLEPHVHWLQLSQDGPDQDEPDRELTATVKVRAIDVDVENAPDRGAIRLTGDERIVLDADIGAV